MTGLGASFRTQVEKGPSLKATGVETYVRSSQGHQCRPELGEAVLVSDLATPSVVNADPLEGHSDPRGVVHQLGICCVDTARL